MTLFPSKYKVLLLACAGTTAASSAVADEPAVPLQLQVDLVVKVLEYAQQPNVQSADSVHIGILIKGGSAESKSFGADLKAALDRVDTVAGRPHDQALLRWADPGALVKESVERRLTVVYLTPGLDSEVPTIARSLYGVQLITVAATDSYVANGAILGFELVSGRPKMLFNIGQARKQDVVFRAAVMKLMRLVE